MIINRCAIASRLDAGLDTLPKIPMQCDDPEYIFLLGADAKTLPGISQPFPEIFDPLNFLSNATSIQEVRRWRESEITHGRVAMLASLGWLVQEAVADKRLLVNSDGRITGGLHV